MPDKERIIAGRYELIKKVGSGGMADVYTATDTENGDKVAVKILKAELSENPKFCERFKAEARAASAMTHPNIVQVLDAGEDVYTDTQGEIHTRSYMVMEHVDGIELTKLVRRGPLKISEACRVTEELLSAVSFAHRAGIIHRDLKPSNIMIARDGRVKIVDFGIARAVGESYDDIAKTTAVLGTAAYFSPEQAKGEKVDARTDLYSVGVVLFEMLTGRAPFQGDTAVAVAHQHIHAQPPLPSSLNAKVTPQLDSIALRALSKTKKDRYQTAKAFATDIGLASEGKDPRSGLLPVVTAAAASAAAGGVGAAGASAGAAGARAAGTSAAGTSAAGTSAPAETNPSPVVGNATAPTELLPTAPDSANSLDLSPSSGATDAAILRPAEERRSGHLHFLDFDELIAPGMAATGPQAFDLSTTEELPDDFEFLFGSDPATAPIYGVPKEYKPPRKRMIITLSIVVAVFAAIAGVGLWFATQRPELFPSMSSTIPAVEGQTYSQAQSLLAKENLTTTKVELSSGTVKSGLVIKTDPPAGTEVEPGSDVTVYVSTGAQKVAVPNVSGLTVDEATALLKSSGFLVGTITETNSGSVPAGLVVDSQPTSGKEIDQGTKINLTTSNGQVELPELVGQTVNEALTILSGPAIRITPTVQADPSCAADGADPVVHWQSVPAGLVPQGTALSIAYCSGH